MNDERIELIKEDYDEVLDTLLDTAYYQLEEISSNNVAGLCNLSNLVMRIYHEKIRIAQGTVEEKPGLMIKRRPNVFATGQDLNNTRFDQNGQ